MKHAESPRLRAIFALALAALCALCPAVPLAEWVPSPPCFAEEPDHSYIDDHIAIRIARYEESDPVRLLYFIADVQITSPESLVCGLSGDRWNGVNEKTSDMARRHGALLAINADDYRTHGAGIIIRNGTIYRSKGSTRHMLTIDGNGDFGVSPHQRTESSYDLARRMLADGIVHVLEFGPILVENGEKTVLKDAFKLVPLSPERREPRTAIAQLGPLHYALVVAEGRTPRSVGMSVPRMQRIFLDLGVQTAFNLDGGGSTTLYFNGEVLNRTASNIERQVSDCIMFK